MNTACVNTTCRNFGTTIAGTGDRCLACTAPTSLASGVILHGPNDTYILGQEIGRGGMGSISVATDSTGAQVVVKNFFNNPDPAAMQENLENRERFKREANYQARMTHPAFPKGFGYFEEYGRLLMVMQFVNGETVTKYIQRCGGKINELDAIQIAIQALSGLDYLHNLTDLISGAPLQLVHRDIKPDNLMVESGSGLVKVLDLGIARPADLSTQTIARGTLAFGSDAYMAPEQVGVPYPGGNPMPFDHRADIHALAATIYHMVTGQAFPLASKKGWKIRLDSVRSDVANLDLQGVLIKALQIDPMDRFADAREFAAELARAHERIAPLPPHIRQFIHAQPATQVFSFGGTGLFTAVSQTLAAPPPQPAPPIAPPPPAQTGPAPNTASVVIDVVSASSAIISIAEWERVVRGRVTRNGKPVANVWVYPFVVDTGGARNGLGQEVKTTPAGEFVLDKGDMRVPLSVERRVITLTVMDSSSATPGAQVLGPASPLTVNMKRPKSYSRQAKKQAQIAAGTYLSPSERIANALRAAGKWGTVPIWGPFWVIGKMFGAAGSGLRQVNWNRPVTALKSAWQSVSGSARIAIAGLGFLLFLLGIGLHWNWLAIVALLIPLFCPKLKKGGILNHLRWMAVVLWGGFWLIVALTHWR